MVFASNKSNHCCLKKVLSRKNASEDKPDKKVIENDAKHTCCFKEIPDKLTNIKNVITSKAEAIKEVIKPEANATDKAPMAKSFENTLYTVD